MKPDVVRHSAFSLLFLWHSHQKAVTLYADMNWRFILSWAIKFALSTVVFDIALAWTQSAWLAFPMALGFLIIIAIAESYVIDWIRSKKDRKETEE